MIRNPPLLEGGSVHWPRVLVLALALALLLSLGVFAATSTTTFAPYNPSWDGTSEFRGQLESSDGVETELITQTTGYDAADPNETVAFVVAPEEPYDEQDVQRISWFLDRGGTLVVLENFGSNGDRLLFDLGTEARLNGQLLHDGQNYERGPTMPVATNVSDHPLTDGIDQLSLNYASAVDPGNATVLVSTSEFAYLADEPTPVEEVDELESYPVATVEDVGDGQVVVLSDPSLVINAMIDRGDNAVFARGLYAGNERVLLDVSKAGDVPPLISILLAVRGSPTLQVLLGVFGIGVVAAAASPWNRSVALRSHSVAKHSRSVARRARTTLTRNSAPIRNSTSTRNSPSTRNSVSAENLERDDSMPRLTHDERVEFLRRRYPEWEDERIHSVAKAFNTTRLEGGQDR